MAGGCNIRLRFLKPHRKLRMDIFDHFLLRITFQTFSSLLTYNHFNHLAELSWLHFKFFSRHDKHSCSESTGKGRYGDLWSKLKGTLLASEQKRTFDVPVLNQAEYLTQKRKFSSFQTCVILSFSSRVHFFFFCISYSYTSYASEIIRQACGHGDVFAVG